MSEKAAVNGQKNFVEKISTFEKIAYGGGDLASNFVLVLTGTFVTFFYTDALGLNAAIVGAIMMFSRLADGFTDIIMDISWIRPIPNTERQGHGCYGCPYR